MIKLIVLIKRFVLNWDFVQREIEIQREQARSEERPKIFQLAQKDVLETMHDDIEEKAEERAKTMVAKLLSVVDERQVVTYDKHLKKVYIGGIEADGGTLGNLKSEAEFFIASNLWKILVESPKKLAQKALFEDDGDSLAVHLKGRSILYLLRTQENILETFRGYAQPQKP